MATASLKMRVLEAAKGRPVPRRSDLLSEKVPVPAAMLLLAAGAMSFVLWVAGGPTHAAGRPLAIGAWMIGGTALLAIAATAVALPPARSMLPRARGQLIAVIACVPVLIGLWVGLWHSSYADPFTRSGFRCFALTALTAPWPFAALLALRRRFDPVHPRLTGGALGAAAGAWSAVMVELWCPLSSAGHVALGHFAPLVLVVLAGVVAGGLLLRPPPVRAGLPSPRE